MAIDLGIDKVMSFVDGCIFDDPSPCAGACPFNINIIAFMKKAAKGRMPGVYKDMARAMLFPTVVVDFCPGYCKANCQRCKMGDEAVDIPAIERAAIKIAGHQAPDAYQIPQKDEKIAIIGAGAAGLSVALNMAQKKYNVTVFDDKEGWGGILRDTPNFSVYEEDFKNQFQYETVDFQFNKKVTSISELSAYDVIYIATGDNGDDFGYKEKLDSKSCFCGDNVFMGGGVIGMDIIHGMAIGFDISKYIEAYAQTGRVIDIVKAPNCIDCNLVPENAEAMPHITPADPDNGYAKDEVKKEAARCFLCSCTKCLDKCEVLDKFRKPPKQCAMEVHSDSGAHFLAGRSMTRETYSCNDCGYCKKVCPSGVDMGDLYMFSREARLKDNIAPLAFHDYWIRRLDFMQNEGFYSALPKGKDSCKYVFFPGCRLSDSMPEYVVKTYEKLNETDDTGIILGCCGAPAKWAGDTPRFEELKTKLLDIWEKYGKPVFVTACTSCTKMFAKSMPEIEVKSLYEFTDMFNGEKLFDKAAIFDPCSASEDDCVKNSVRDAVSSCGIEIEELKEQGKCCGYGGHMKAANPKLYDKIKNNRAKMSELPYIVYCANCREVFISEDKPVRHILELAFGEYDKTYTLDEKHSNILKLKAEFMKEIEGETFMPEKHEWDEVKLLISDEVRSVMEDQLISDDDIKHCIYQSVKDDDRFVDDNDVYLASLVCKVIVFWVEYKELDNGAYEVISAYSHRMHFSGVEA